MSAWNVFKSTSQSRGIWGSYPIWFWQVFTILFPSHGWRWCSRYRDINFQGFASSDPNFSSTQSRQIHFWGSWHTKNWTVKRINDNESHFIILCLLTLPRRRRRQNLQNTLIKSNRCPFTNQWFLKFLCLVLRTFERFCLDRTWRITWIRLSAIIYRRYSVLVFLSTLNFLVGKLRYLVKTNKATIRNSDTM